MSGPKRSYSRPIEVLGVAKALDHVRDDVADAVPDEVRAEYARWLEAERAGGRLEIPEEVIGSLAGRAATIAGKVAGKIAREKAATGVAEAFQIGVNKSATEADHEADTVKTMNTCPSCGRPVSEPVK